MEHNPYFRSGNQQLVILTQLLQASVHMHHIDEMFVWLASMIVQHLNIQALQFWAHEASPTGQTFVVLRTTVCQDESLPGHIFTNTHIAEVAGYLLRERHGAPPQSIDVPFSSYSSDLLKRYGLNYWFGYLLSSDFLLPPGQDTPPESGMAIPFAVIALLFLRQHPPQDLLLTTSHILEQIIPTAKNRALLVAPAVRGDWLSTERPDLQRGRPLLPLGELIPHPLPDVEAMRSRSPFAADAAISDRKAQRLYLVIDGQKSVTELSSITQMDTKDMYMSLHTLVAQKRIQLFDPQGNPVDNSLFFDTH